MTSSALQTTEGDVQELIEDALIIPVTFLKDEAVRNAEADSIGGAAKSEEVAGYGVTSENQKAKKDRWSCENVAAA